MRRLTLYLILIGVFFVQLTLFHKFVVFGVKPDLVLLFTLAAGFYQGVYRGMSVGFFGGLMEDVYSAANLGTNALSKLVCGFLVTFVGRKIYDNIGTQVFVIFVFSLVDRLLTFIVLSFTSPGQSFSGQVFLNALIFAGYNVLFGFFIFPLVKKLTGSHERISHY